MTTKPQLRSRVPKAIEIIKYWQSIEGIKRLKSIEDAFGGEDCARLIEKFFSIDADCPACMSCGRPRSEWSKLERCHILGVTHAYESNQPIDDVSAAHNFVLMCRPCHVDSPTTTDEMTFWQWMQDTPTRAEALAEGVRTMIASYGVAVATKAFDAFMNTEPMVVEGRISINTLISGMRSHARSIARTEPKQQSERSSVDEMLEEYELMHERINAKRAPYGKEWKDGALVDNPEEMEVLALIRELRCTGLTFRALAAELEARGVINRKGRAVWSLSTLKAICDGDTHH